MAGGSSYSVNRFVTERDISLDRPPEDDDDRWNVIEGAARSKSIRSSAPSASLASGVTLAVAVSRLVLFVIFLNTVRLL